MASRVLVVGHSGLIGRAILSAPTSIEFVLAESRINFKPLSAGKFIISEALEKSCSAILNLAWASNSSDDFDNLEVQSDFEHSTEDFARLAIDSGLKMYLVGTCLDSNPFSDNRYVSAKSRLKNSLKEFIEDGSIIWFRPFFIISLTERRPRLVRGILAEPKSSFLIHSPYSTNDYVLVDDIATGIIQSIEGDLRGEIDLGSGILTSNLKIAQIVCQMRDIPLPRLGNRPAKEGVAANIEVLRLRNWQPKATLNFMSGQNK